jgi:hypothetical protein
MSSIVKIISNKSNYYIISIILNLLILSNGCEISSPEDVIESGRVKVNLIFVSTGDIEISENDVLFTQARDFKVFNGQNFADVFQNPNQFLEYSDSIVTFNLLRAAKKDSVVQVAFGSVPPLTYDSLLFQIAPSNFIVLENNYYPLTTNYNDLIINNNFSKVIRIKDKIKVEENKTTTINVHLKVEDIVFRILDDFVFSAVADTFYILNE